ncbi:RNA-binding transcriptional accessory protein [Halioglobus japonicus]|uniref:RNA-binding transcriptional accessory protein n=1 Tax=Halioglobus japonicus TaxID=930805 RepID=A0AAP8MBS5_9GAMM|nr:Tex family protein [Halioglobus japonicus]AQA20084.1 RNA-binding transcriptional accessory protein [Halioglobus japonicus]PLW84893.1 RNA-binding transcriptional accessory protein [Halioglobus japonicus]
MQSIPQRIAEELSVREAQVNAAIGLLDEGATVPFIARYRKEVTGALDDTQMRNLEERLHYLRDMEERRETILASIDEQGKLTPELKKSLLEADTKNRLEDLYLPYKPKRRTKAQIAREAGLEPLADALLDDPTQDPEALAPAYYNKEAGIEDNKAALDGARQILMERFAEDADLLAKLRQFLTDNALLASRLMEGKENEGAKFRDYFEHTEALAKVPSHRALAMFRGRNESILNLNLVMDADEKPTDAHPCEAMVADHWKIEDHGRPADRWLREAVRWTWRVKLLTHLQTDLLGQLRERAEAEAIEVFAHNLKDLLLAAPAGQKATIGLDPGLRTGVKVAVIDATGKVLDHGAIFPNPPQKKLQEAEATLLHMIRQHNVELIAIGNGTASRETDKFVGDLFKANPDLNVRKVMVNEAGASIYSASEFAAREFPDLDVTIRGAISIARRLQDPLAELVKIEPKSIGVGQYQHDVSQVQLARQLDAVVEDCVNAVGVDVNTASVPLLARVSGLNQSIATNIVSLRDAQGKFANRKALMDVSRFGEKTFEQAAGFLRVSGGDNPLDASAVHPESYGVVEDIAAQKQREVRGIIGDSSFLKGLNPADYTSDQVGLPTVRDIIAELDKPGRDPRPEFKMAEFQDGVEKISDLRPDMILEGTVTNVTNFGAFVDIGVHQDGLVHISALADKFVKDPRDVVKAGDIVRVKVMEVDEARKRIGLSMRMGDKAGEQEQRGGGQRRDKRGGQRNFKQRQEKPAANNAFAAAFANAKQRK